MDNVQPAIAIILGFIGGKLVVDYAGEVMACDAHYNHHGMTTKVTGIGFVATVPDRPFNLFEHNMVLMVVAKTICNSRVAFSWHFDLLSRSQPH